MNTKLHVKKLVLEEEYFIKHVQLINYACEIRLKRILRSEEKIKGYESNDTEKATRYIHHLTEVILLLYDRINELKFNFDLGRVK